jgi:hypothetical protein
VPPCSAKNKPETINRVIEMTNAGAILSCRVDLTTMTIRINTTIKAEIKNRYPLNGAIG